MTERAEYVCHEMVNSSGRVDRRRGYKECGHHFEAMTPSDVRDATGGSITCPLCGGIPHFVGIRGDEIEVKAMKAAKRRASKV